VFIEPLGNIRPSGFLPVQRGNVRTADLAEVYRSDEIFRRLRNDNALLDRCGRCRFRAICGGSLARVRGDRRGDGVGSAVCLRTWTGLC
jgi:radical SAM protein with 4Fe4S-binding SPASM domain